MRTAYRVIKKYLDWDEEDIVIVANSVELAGVVGILLAAVVKTNGFERLELEAARMHLIIDLVELE